MQEARSKKQHLDCRRGRDAASDRGLPHATPHTIALTVSPQLLGPVTMSSFLRAAINPATYRAAFADVIRTKRAQMNAGSFRPVVEGMIFTSVISYLVHYTFIDRYQIMEKQKIVKEALKDFGGH